MKALLYTGLLLIALGIASLVVPIPRTETEGVRFGNVNIGVQARHSELVSPVISALLLVGGVALSIAGASKARSGN